MSIFLQLAFMDCTLVADWPVNSATRPASAVVTRSKQVSKETADQEKRICALEAEVISLKTAVRHLLTQAGSDPRSARLPARASFSSGLDASDPK